MFHKKYGQSIKFDFINHKLECFDQMKIDLENGAQKTIKLAWLEYKVRKYQIQQKRLQQEATDKRNKVKANLKFKQLMQKEAYKKKLGLEMGEKAQGQLEEFQK